MRGKLGISAIVATVLVILITVAGVTIIWVVIIPMISENVAFDELSGRVSIVSSGGYTLYDAEEEVAIVQVKRDIDDGVVDRIKIIFNIGGDSVSSTVVAPESGQTKTYTFDFSGYGEPEFVSVAPIFVSDSGREKEGVEQSKVDMPVGKILDVGIPAYDVGKDYFYEMPVDGLVSWLKFNGDFTDSASAGVVTEFGGIATSDGAGVFDGVDDYVFVNDTVGATNFGLSDSYTVMGWVKLNDLASDTSITEHWEGTPYPWAIRTNNGISFGVYNGSSGGSNGLSIGAPDYLYNWRHFAAVKDMGQSRIFLYIDGGEFVKNRSVTITGDTASSNNGFTIGARRSIGSKYVNSSMDNIMVYNRALSEEEIVAIFENQRKD